MPKKNSLLHKHNYIRLSYEECKQFFEMIKGTSIEDEKFLKRKSTPGYVYVYRRDAHMFRGEKFGDWKKIVRSIYAGR